MWDKTKRSDQRGFTLIEIILVVVALSIIAGIVILAINPSKQLGDTRNAQRYADVNTILNAVYQYAADNGGVIPASIVATPTEICTTGIAPATCTTDSLTDLSVITADEKYLISIPKDPSCPAECAASGAGYEISRTANNRITVSAPNQELGKVITATR